MIFWHTPSDSVEDPGPWQVLVVAMMR